MKERDVTVNNIRVRALICFVLVQFVTHFVNNDSTVLHHALKYQFIAEAFVCTSTFIMLESLVVVSTAVVGLSIVLYGALGSISLLKITRCINIYQTSQCFADMPIDLVVFALFAVVGIIALLQFMSVRKLNQYVTLKTNEETSQHILQRRTRLLHIWCIPFLISLIISSTHWFIFIIVSLCFAPLLAYIATEDTPEGIHIIGFGLSTLITVVDIVHLVFSARHVSDYYVYCLATIILFDVLATFLRTFMASYKPPAKPKED